MSEHRTPNLSLPYYDEDDPPNGAIQQKNLALAIDPLGTVPVGAMFMWPVAAAPAGYLFMQGQQVDAATYPVLAQLFGQDTGGKVTIPDMRDTFPAGAGATMALGSTGGVPTVVLATAHMPVHSHGGKTGSRDRSGVHLHPASDAGGYFATYATSGGVVYLNGAAEQRPGLPSTGGGDGGDHMHVINAEGGGAAHENRPPYRAVNFIIRAG